MEAAESHSEAAESDSWTARRIWKRPGQWVAAERVAVTQQGGLKPRAHEVWQRVLPEAAIVPSGSLSVSSGSRLLRERFARKDRSGIAKGTVVGVA